ncbi:ABC-2 type transport system ATP-binding protein [Nannocystis exedens]|uniref:ABC-2 type transport system ATP-binding protein n=1 Tax=Nannocystis exedens TaxID=54 RepID=A0A1I2HP49_9BACT|nr:ABC transporter ATP-binding protein [Nannocystis exedens]PCC69351.1 ABC transporter ATP-binding protein [Nannocystis exedens]SFF31070.1 ABC-2 type transport system ATP-binding protein [Nannocystis exedens]
MLRAEALTKRYEEVEALTGLELEVRPGEVYCLLGPNGAGKSTTMNLFLGFAAPTAGRAWVCGLDVQHHLIESKRHLAYIPEQVHLYPHLSGAENLEYFAGLGGSAVSGPEIAALLERVGLPAAAHHRRSGEYSKGMRQKVGLAIAVAKRARALLLDEPTSGLDPRASFEFSRLVRSMCDEGVAVLMATHDLFRARDLASRIGIMSAGRLVWEGGSGDLAGEDLERVYLEHVRRAAEEAAA